MLTKEQANKINLLMKKLFVSNVCVRWKRTSIEIDEYFIVYDTEDSEYIVYQETQTDEGGFVLTDPKLVYVGLGLTDAVYFVVRELARKMCRSLWDHILE